MEAIVMEEFLKWWQTIYAMEIIRTQRILLLAMLNELFPDLFHDSITSSVANFIVKGKLDR